MGGVIDLFWMERSKYIYPIAYWEEEFSGGSMVKNLPASAEDMSSIAFVGHRLVMAKGFA